jgi:hypothetical protein
MKVRLIGLSALLGWGARSLWLMELTMATRKTITKAQAVRYRNGSRAVKWEILDVVCAVTEYHRDYARRALRLALTPREVKARARRPRKYEADVVAALERCWAVDTSRLRAITAGIPGTLQATRGRETRKEPSTNPMSSNSSQADSTGSIPVTRSRHEKRCSRGELEDSSPLRIYVSGPCAGHFGPHLSTPWHSPFRFRGRSASSVTFSRFGSPVFQSHQGVSPQS